MSAPRLQFLDKRSIERIIDQAHQLLWDPGVMVYAPDDVSTPWLTGVCDDEGCFSFTPDVSIPGIWDVKVRLAGHGGMVHIPVGEVTATSGGIGGYSYLQIALMIVCVIWGSIGTALYFRRRRTA